MPLYFFHSSGGASAFDSPDGFDLADDDAAWSMAVSSTGELLRDLDGRMPDRSEIVVTVTDESQRLVVTLSITGTRGKS